MTNRLDYSNLDPKVGPRPFALSLDCFNRASRPGAYKIPLTRTIQAQSDKFIFVYLGGRLNLALDWTEITKRARAGINRELCRLQRKRYTLAEAAAVASSIIQGKAGFLLQLAQFPLGMLQKWDSQLDRILRLKAGSAFSGSAAMFHAPKDKGGLGIFSFQSLAAQSLGTELLVRLQARASVGRLPGPAYKQRNVSGLIMALHPLPARNTTLPSTASIGYIGGDTPCVPLGTPSRHSTASLRNSPSPASLVTLSYF